jgi:hypothetical protein
MHTPTLPLPPTHRLIGLMSLATALCATVLSAQPQISPALEKFAAARNVGLTALSYDLTRATVITPPNVSGPEEKAVAMLVEETESRTLVRWPVVHARKCARSSAPGRPRRRSMKTP